MADTKITALTAISTVDPAVDVLPIVDVSDTTMAASGTTKKITSNQILGAGGTATLASATITGDLTVDTSTLKVDSANDRVGIGIATPAWPLDIRSATGVAQILSTTGTNAAYLQVSNTGGIFYLGRENSAGTSFASPAYSAVLYAGGAYPLVTTVNGGERYRIASDGVATWSNVGGVAGTAMTLNSTGLGVGVTPSAARLEVGGQDGTQFYIRSTGTTPSKIRGFTNAAEAGVIGFLNGGGIYFDISGERMRIDSSGNVGVGVTPSAWDSGYQVIENSGGSFWSGSTGAIRLSQNAYFATSLKYKTTNAATNYVQTAGAHQWFNAPSGTAGNAITFTQAMTLDASGNLLVGTTTNGGNGVSIRPSTASPNAVLVGSDTSGGTAWQMYSTGTSSSRFYVTWAGTINAVNTTIAAISDARLKENVQDIDVGLGAILALKPRKFDWKAGKGKDIKGDRGFIAQEFEQVFPQLVDEWADPAPEGEAPYKSVRQDLIPVLVKAIQELAAEVNALKNA